MRILMAGVSHKTAPVALREKLALDAARTSAVLRDLRARYAQAEFVVLSTCNRTEICCTRPVHGHPREQELREELLRLGALDERQAGRAVYLLTDERAVRHVFQVAAGLDSLVPGEAQIVAQLKDAYSAAVRAGAARSVMNELMQDAFHVAKHVRSETPVGTGRVSVASVAIDRVSRQLGDLGGTVVLNVGAGKMNDLMVRRLAQRGAGRIVVVNRSPARARELAARCGGKAAPWRSLARRIEQADVVLCSTGSTEPIITRRMVRDAMRARAGRPLLLIDIAVPRDVEQAAGDIKGVVLYNIDDLEAVVRSSFRARRGGSRAARRIIDEHVEAFWTGLGVRQVAPTIEALEGFLRRIAEEELQTARRKLSTHGDAEQDEEILRRALHRTIRRILHPLARSLREKPDSPSARTCAAALRRAFGLEDDATEIRRSRRGRGPTARSGRARP